MTDANAVLLGGPLASRARDAIDAVARAIVAYPGDAPFAVLASVADRAERDALQVSLSNGWAGVALLFDALAAARPGAGYHAVASRLVEQAIAAAPQLALDASLHGGFVGIAFAAELVADPDGDDPSTEVDAALVELLARPWRGDLDVIDGLSGIGAYLLERLRHGRPGAAAALAQLVARLEETARRDRAGLAWPMRHGVCELGLAHGVAGIVALLAKLHVAGIARARVRPLLDGGVAWLRGFERADAVARFPGAITARGRVVAARQGWCSGDLAVATALLAAAHAIGDPVAAAGACDLAVDAAAAPPERVASVDASLCHGAAGAGHLLHRMYRATGDPRLATAARRWLARACSLRRDSEGIGGFSTHEGEPSSAEWLAHPGLLVGAAGTALALLAATEPWDDPRWDRALLLGGP